MAKFTPLETIKRDPSPLETFPLTGQAGITDKRRRFLTGPVRAYFSNGAGFSLAELIIVVIIIGIMAFVAVPRLQFGGVRRKKAEITASKIVTDLRHTRLLAITNAAENTNGYRLTMQGGAPYSSYQITNLQTSEVVDTYSIDSEVSCMGDSQFSFGPLGNLLSGSGSTISVSSEGKSFTITVISATGMVKNTEN